MDLTKAAMSVSRVLENEYQDMKNGSLWLIQDGKEAGQTVSILRAQGRSCSITKQ